MTTSTPALQALLIDLVCARRPADVDLDKRDWDALMAMARHHRLAPLLHWRLTREASAVPVPQAVRAQLASAFAKGTLRALQVQRELLLVHRILESAGIPHVALKGAYLAHHCYPTPALRPLRDLDVLVPPDRALAAFQALMADGYVRPSRFQGNPEAWLIATKHLPPLRTPSGSVHLELHSRLYLPRQVGGEQDPGLWRRLVRKSVAGHDLAFLSPADLLLHLIVHAAYDHHFDNGPLLLTDIEGLLREPSLDWPLFWELAEAGGWMRGCLLVLAMVERHFPDATIPYPAALAAERQRIPADLLAATASLTLGLSGARSDLRLVAGMKRASTMRDKLKPLRDSVFPSKRMIATMYPVREDSAAVYLWYLVKWGRMAMISLPRFLATRQKARATVEIDQGARLAAWLDGG